ncbi:MAG TPA: hypothetical protein VKA59_12230 [Vicinamibacterales bacterium]|nr:hypothetical protein [Vicinamibacterales bacterium]
MTRSEGGFTLQSPLQLTVGAAFVLSGFGSSDWVVKVRARYD